jgi:hypothetical protein
MQLTVSLAECREIQALREFHRWEMNCQIIHDSWLGRGWVDGYLLEVEGRPVGYGLVGGVRGDPKNTVIEYYVHLADRGHALPLFRQLLARSNAQLIETQSNDRLLTLMLYDTAETIEAQEVLFSDQVTTALVIPGAVVRRTDPSDVDQLKRLDLDAEAGWLMEVAGEMVAAGGILFHYNPPFGDIYMKVAETKRRRGYGSYFVQELKRDSYDMGKVPAARCNANNAASRATLQRAGMLPCGRMLVGKIS